jgi:hypothetical protein
VNLEGLKCPKIAAKPGDGIADHGQRLVTAGHAKYPGTRKPMNATQVGEREIPAVVDVKVEVQVIRPHAYANARGGEGIERRLADQADDDTGKAQPRIHSTIVYRSCAPAAHLAA